MARDGHRPTRCRGSRDVSDAALAAGTGPIAAAAGYPLEAADGGWFTAVHDFQTGPVRGRVDLHTLTPTQFRAGLLPDDVDAFDAAWHAALIDGSDVDDLLTHWRRRAWVAFDDPAGARRVRDIEAKLAAAAADIRAEPSGAVRWFWSPLQAL